MNYQLHITLTEEDYLNFNIFHVLDSASGKKQIRKSRILLISITAVLAVLLILVMGWTTFTTVYVILLALFTLIYNLLFNKIIQWNIKSQIKQMKKTGKLPYDSVTKYEFHEDTFAEITADKHVEMSYSTLERICVVQDRFLYLYTSSVVAHILPMEQIKAQVDPAEFLRFLSQKCGTVESYPLVLSS